MGIAEVAPNLAKGVSDCDRIRIRGIQNRARERRWATRFRPIGQQRRRRRQWQRNMRRHDDNDDEEMFCQDGRREAVLRSEEGPYAVGLARFSKNGDVLADGSSVLSRSAS